jgi:hypothetical protein
MSTDNTLWQSLSLSKLWVIRKHLEVMAPAKKDLAAFGKKIKWVDDLPTLPKELKSIKRNQFAQKLIRRYSYQLVRIQRIKEAIGYRGELTLEILDGFISTLDINPSWAEWAQKPDEELQQILTVNLLAAKQMQERQKFAEQSSLTMGQINRCLYNFDFHKVQQEMRLNVIKWQDLEDMLARHRETLAKTKKFPQASIEDLQTWLKMSAEARKEYWDKLEMPANSLVKTTT